MSVDIYPTYIEIHETHNWTQHSGYLRIPTGVHLSSIDIDISPLLTPSLELPVSPSVVFLCIAVDFAVALFQPFSLHSVTVRLSILF